MNNNPVEQEVNEMLDYKIRKRVANKVLTDIHQQVDEIEKQIDTEQKAKRLVFPLLFLAFLILITLTGFWPEVFRFFSGFIN